MLTIICESPKNLQALEQPLPARAAGEVLLRVKRVGVCGTDLHIFTGNQPYLAYPRVMGHELSGVVEEADAGSGLAPGDPVYVMPYLSCGHCVACRQGKTNCCVRIQVLGVHRDGAMTEFLSVPQGFVHKAEGITLDQAAMLEFLAIGAHAVRRGAVAAGQRVLVVGAGPIGLAAMIFSRLRGAQVTAIDGRQDRLDFALQKVGVASAVALGDGDEAELSRLTGGEFFDVVFDATGNAGAMERGFRFIAHGGRYVLVSIVQGDIQFSDPEFHKREATLLSSRNATTEDFETVMAAMRAGQVPDKALATHRMALGDVPAQFAGLLDPGAGVIKAIVEC
ncbi:L-iditol 2-dehydrogenase [Paracidovorax avenae ATCC 19860]|uniref:L-iditol 2-dehydrogenase n=1 Tax=Paracidovorax avenae (strain ATCC 19860 / DSM 7227 / CCUG 15838 / JCM 20985 / LMG 2117 / NCPPB 1011) TaxID=643561 RepID=F0Q4S1_PARA1|nr:MULTISPECIES: zinc-binding alcohol dehydrogenase family protein [Comamonadaceae]ADX45575.1 L-iditol 2-dehydrogenase [Paracidovorax avenae ATCC 19860]AVS68211.1 dehydrogenase [Paracidovorax avenae]MDA8452906.1 zinc-binding alcohol dehydrogenase family protein [Acidovorax sp. GBBC 3297]MDA8462313.1 zinc-binding alcohol dehydrogenase family protein [Acidovorax sp. GBBC 3333]MDA8467347.1 zinc-binding alcohol dehydrogenase family protein [Acidovorax sp. GBBC 3332]